MTGTRGAQVLERIGSALLTVAALAIAFVLVRREFFPPDNASGATAAGPRFVERWETILASGIRVGSEGARATLVEFVDFECPFCKRYHETVMRSMRQAFGDSLAVVYVHFPLSMHRHASAAAHAAECASRQGRFEPFVDAIYNKQDSLGSRSWNAYAGDAAVADMALFGRCVGSAKSARIDSGLAIGARIGVAGTPSIMLNGWLFRSPPSDTLLARTIRDALDGRRPFKGD